MFSKQIIDSDAFLDMSPTAQLLYFHLVMRADDEGFVGNPKKIMREVGIQSDDFKILIAKRFLIVFESGVIVIKHWLIHNTIRMDRFNQTSYLDEKNQIITKENRAYTERQPLGNHLEPQVKLSEVKLDIAPEVAKEFNLKEEIKKLMDSERRELRIIGWFIHEKRVTLKNKGQLQTTIKRHLRPAKLLTSFEVGQLKTSADNAERQLGNKWTLETLYKLLTK